MKNKINVAKILKDCPSGMELDCTMLEGLEFDDIIDNEYLPIRCRVKNPDGGYNVYNFTKYGCWLDTTFAKCVIFPKGKTTWEGFHRPFKDGDIAISESGDIHLLQTSSSSYCSYRESWEILHKFDSAITTNVTIVRLATEEEKEKLFKAIKANGYKWNAETKTLEKLIEPKFKVGDRIKNKNDKWLGTRTIQSYVVGIGYFTTINDWVRIEDQDEYELVPNKFDINTLKPFESRVLVRDRDNDEWRGQFFSHYNNCSDRPYICIGNEGLAEYKQCIPYEGNKHLLGTTDDCDEYYKTW